MTPLDLQKLKVELAIKAKKGADFIGAASFVWITIAYIWTLSMTSYNKSVLTFIVGSLLLPLAFALSKILKTNWKVKDNPLQPLGLWLNFAQLFYFPFLIFILLKQPDYFLMTYAIITGAHLFPYAWFYEEKVYAIVAGAISLGSFFIALNTNIESMYFIALFVGVTFLAMFVLLLATTRSASKD